MIVVWLFLAVPRVCLQFVIVVFPNHTHLLFYLFPRCPVIVVWLFLAVPRVCLQFVIVVIPNHTYYFNCFRLE